MAKYYTPIPVKSPANADTFNSPLQELDDQIDVNASQLAEQLALIQAHAAALQEQLAAIQSNTANIASQAELVQELAADSTIHDQQLESLDGRLDTAESDIQAQGTALSGLAGQVGQVKTDIDNLEGDVAGLDSDLTDVATDVSVLKGQMAAAESRLTTAEGDIDAVESGVAGLDTRVTAAEGDISDAESDISGLDTRVTALEQDQGYTLPTATASDLGGVKVGSGLSIDQAGVLSASGGGGYVALCTTAASTAEKTITIPGITAYYDGLIVNIVLTAGHTASGMKFNINGLGAKTVLYYPYNTSWIVVDAVYYNGQFRVNAQHAGYANSVIVKPESNVTNENYIGTTLSQGRYYLTVNNKKCLLEVISVPGFAVEQTLTYVPETVTDTPVIKKKYGLYTTGSGWTYTPWIQVYPAVQSV